jgi:hypothetical protein
MGQKFLMGQGWTKKVEIFDGAGVGNKVKIIDGSLVGQKS